MPWTFICNILNITIPKQCTIYNVISMEKTENHRAMGLVSTTKLY
jgi:hypothetical protein